MSVSAIFSQPQPNEIRSATRPTIIGAVAAINDIVYCDVYINTVFYRTLVSTTSIPSDIIAGLGWDLSQYRAYQFDLQDTIQECLTYHMPQVKLPINSMFVSNDGYVFVSCKLRGSTQTNGVWRPDGIAPVQATADTPAIAGNGLQSYSFFVLNASPQHEDDIQFSAFLINNCKFDASITNLQNVYTLQTNKVQTVAATDYNYFSVLFGFRPFQSLPSNALSTTIQVKATLYQGGSPLLSNVAVSGIMTANQSSVLHIPSGIPNINGVGSAWLTADSYRLYVWDMSTNLLLAASPLYKISRINNPDRKRIWFMNKFGIMQAVSFTDYSEQLKVSSTIGQIPLNPKGFNDQTTKLSSSIFRDGIDSNETVTLIQVFQESDMPWLKELFDTPVAYVEYSGTSTNGQVIPIVINDDTFDVRKQILDDRWAYEVTMKYTMSNPNIRQRNY